MMTSVTLPSSSGPLHGGYSSAGEEAAGGEGEFEARPTKRCSGSAAGDPCKKRRKQSTPVRISAVESEEGKPTEAAEEIECKREPEEFGLATAQPWLGELPSLPALPMFMFAQPESVPRQPVRIFNPDAYCDLCNKEFCNKYFLKTHKANKHGIYSDPPVAEPAPYAAGTVKLPNTVPSVELTAVKNEKGGGGIINTFNNLFPSPFPKKVKLNLPGLFDSEINENVPNSNGFASNCESDKVIDEHQPAEESSSPRNVQTDTTSFTKNDPDVYYIPQSKVSPGNDTDLSNRLRRIGVMNPKAFCEICCKEYCNKYFLRTHKMKRHGIYIPDDRDKDSKTDLGNFPWQNNMQTSPLNLIMTEQSNTDRKTTSPSDISCDICGIKFQNASLSQLHNISVHSKDDHQEIEEIKKETQSNEKSINAEAISEDLQKLQTMILQLNELDVGKVCTTCNACNKEFENRYFLHAHMMTDHGILLDDVAEVDKAIEPHESTTNNNTMCELCGKDIQNLEEMKKHMSEAHPNHQETIKEEFNGFNSTPEKSMNRVSVSSTERRISMNVTPTSSYCDICNKELCNKYFMKTHMQRMHGIEIENGAQIGGVICDICNKELCSKYFLRVHKHNTHGIVEYGTSLLQPRKTEGESSVPHMPPDPDPALKPADLADLSHRYFTHFTEVCSICNRRFRSTKWLKAHLLSDHGQAGAEKWSELEQQLQQSIGGQHSKSGIKSERASPTLKIPNGGQERKEGGIQNVLSSLFGVDESNAKSYTCSYCPFTTPLLPLLFVHERSHSMTAPTEGGLKCPVCGQTFLQPELLQHHVFAQHPFLPLPPFFNGSENQESGEGGEEVGKKKGKAQKMEGEVGQSLKEMAKRVQVPATYALPQGAEDAGYVMQAFLVEEAAAERRMILPAVVFLPVFQKQPAPLTVTFTLTPA